MVKITNPLGDVKIGRQGEVVYQRKYGEQIRRTASPKRAIPSQRQVQHRQLYKAALGWRSQLSLPNRRYLDGYCIANGIVDSYHIPLPWSRFALKLYLQHVQFVIITKPIAGAEGEEGLYENYTTGDTTQGSAYGVRYLAQTFTPLAAHKITKVILKLWKKGTPGTAIVSIKATDGAGHPTGDDLCSGTTDGNTLPTSAPYEWREISLGAGYNLAANVKYAIQLKAPDGSFNNYVYWRLDSTGTYPRGDYEYSSNSGQSWNTFVGYDLMFEEYGATPGIPPVLGLLHVRHPALLTVVHKRGELTVNGYDTLSSLDEEYLTGQVGLDIELGDFIEATTLPGISYAHPIL